MIQHLSSLPLRLLQPTMVLGDDVQMRRGLKLAVATSCNAAPITHHPPTFQLVHLAGLQAPRRWGGLGSGRGRGSLARRAQVEEVCVRGSRRLPLLGGRRRAGRQVQEPATGVAPTFQRQRLGQRVGRAAVARAAWGRCSQGRTAGLDLLLRRALAALRHSLR